MPSLTHSDRVVAPPPPSPTAPEMKRIANLRERFVGGENIELGSVPKLIHESWIRSRAAGVDPLLARAPCNQEAAWVADAEICLPGANKVIAFLANFFVEPHQLITLVDRQCRVLAIRGGRKALARAERIAAVPGADWSEAATGCNALSTSMFTNQPVQVSWHENYINAVVDWTGVAAPIRHPGTGAVRGAIGISGFDTLTHPKVTALCIEASEMISAAINAADVSAQLAVLAQYSRLLAQYPSDGLLAVNGDGRIIGLTPMAARLGATATHSGLIGRYLHETPFGRQLGIDAGSSLRMDQLASRTPSGVHLIPVDDLPPNSGMIILIEHKRGGSVRVRTPPRDWPARYSFDDLIGDNRAFRDAIDRSLAASKCDLAILIEGESGTGKELVAQSIHNASARSTGPFVPLDCATLGDDLIGMELFGYEEGSFTGAVKGGKEGKFHLAHGGTLFLDDVDNLPPKVQMGLLRVLESGQVVRLGGTRPQPVDVRVVTASNRNLMDLVTEGRFRHDLYFRLNVITLRLPALRERPDDLGLLARHVLEQHGSDVELTDGAMQMLEAYQWPGNIRELRNVMLEAATFARDHRIVAADLRQRLGCNEGREGAEPGSRRSVLDNADAALLERTVAACSSVCEAAQRLGLHHATLYRRMKKYGIAFPRKRRALDS